jgi:hypothetical protein
LIASQIAIVENELARLGFGKADKAVIEQAARIITGKTDLNHVAGNGNIGEIKNLITIYQESKLNEFLQVDFDRLPVPAKLEWLRNIVDNPESGFQNLTFGMAFSGRGGFIVSTLFEAYRDKDKEVKDYAGQMLEIFLLA